MDNILILGGAGFLGGRTKQRLCSDGYRVEVLNGRADLDLRDGQQFENYLSKRRIAVIINCAADVGGIEVGYKRPADLFYNNMLMLLNLYNAAARTGVSKIINPISNCAYPGNINLFREELLWSGDLHESVRSYGAVRRMASVSSHAYSKQFGIKTLNLVFSNMFGPGDHFHPSRSHALGAIMHKMHVAKSLDNSSIEIWGSGNPRREWTFVDDAVDAIVKGIDYEGCYDLLNVGVGKAISIRELVGILSEVVGFKGDITYDALRPDGASEKMVDGSKGMTELGWMPRQSLVDAIRITYNYYLQEFNGGNKR